MKTIKKKRMFFRKKGCFLGLGEGCFLVVFDIFILCKYIKMRL